MQQTNQYRYIAAVLTGILVATFLFFAATSAVQAQSEYLTPNEGQITFAPGLRIQGRYAHNRIDGNDDFFIQRLRLKGAGNVFDLANYYFEVKIDGEGKFNRTPRAQVENAWLNFAANDNIAVRFGLYDFVFSRNALTSDSKLLLMDRSLIKDALTVLGLADNTVGVLVHGRPLGGRLTYGFGVFDNIGFETSESTGTIAREADGVMTSGRLVYDFLDPANPGGYGDYRGSYVGQGQRLSVGANAAYQRKARIGDTEFDLFAWGVDLFFNTGPVVVEAEYDSYKEDVSSGQTPNIVGDGWYAQAGYLILPKLEAAARYQELDPNDNVTTDKLKWTTLGLNYYIRGHNLKIQGEYTFKNEESEEITNDTFQLQLQFDF